MGIYTIKCTGCLNNFSWFSGNSIQLCSNCQEKLKKEEEFHNMTQESLNLEALNKVVSVQADFIQFLKQEIERLKALQLASPHYPPLGPSSHQPLVPSDQNPQILPVFPQPTSVPNNPFINPTYPYTVISGTVISESGPNGGSITTSTKLPTGGGQIMGSGSNTNYFSTLA